LVCQIREIESILATPVDKSDISQFADMKEIFQKSVVSKVAIPEGATITLNMLGIKKPGTGLAPKYINQVVGTRALRSLPEDTVITAADVSLGS